MGSSGNPSNSGQGNSFNSSTSNWRNPTYGSVNANRNSWNMPDQSSFSGQSPGIKRRQGGGYVAFPQQTVTPEQQYQNGGLTAALPNTPTESNGYQPPVSTKNVYYNGGIKTPEQMGMTPAVQQWMDTEKQRQERDISGAHIPEWEGGTPTAMTPEVKQYFDNLRASKMTPQQRQPMIAPDGYQPPVSTKNVYYNGGIKTPEQMGMTPAVQQWMDTEKQRQERDISGAHIPEWEGGTPTAMTPEVKQYFDNLRASKMTPQQRQPMIAPDGYQPRLQPTEFGGGNPAPNLQQQTQPKIPQTIAPPAFNYNTRPNNFGYNSGGYRGGK